MGKKFFLILIVSAGLFLASCSELSFDDISIEAADVLDAQAGKEFYLSYSIADFEKYDEKFDLTVSVSAFDEKNIETDVRNNRYMIVEKDKIYTVEIRCSAEIGGSIKYKSARFKVYAEKSPPESPKIRYFVNDSEKEPEMTREVAAGESLTTEDLYPVPEYAPTGYKIVGKYWEKAKGKQVSDEDLKDINESIDLYAHYVYERIEYTLTFVYDEGGTRTDHIKGTFDDALLKPRDPFREGYRFDGWYKNKKLTEKFDWERCSTFGAVSSLCSDAYCCSLYAKWVPEQDNSGA